MHLPLKKNDLQHGLRPLADGSGQDARNIYFKLMSREAGDNEQDVNAGYADSRGFLDGQLHAARRIPCDLPDDVNALADWIEKGTQRVGRQYRDYLDMRRAGGPRRFFTNRAHALHFLNAVAPTKLVDGAWLYGVLERWDDARYASLIRIYLEELGEGRPDKNHVTLYRKLLASHGCESWTRLSSAHFTQGAIQLALARHADALLPEVIGYNLGYEQLPLHLLITAYELNELGIDPYYFTLHVTVDNAATGHARKAAQSVADAMPQVADRKVFWQRMADGYRLNMLGIDTPAAIGSFDIEQELLSVLASKAAVGAQVHSDYCRVGGRTVSDWLSDPGRIPAFLAALEQAGWIRRHQDPQHSRFWKLIDGERAEMFGVFTAYERQVIHDWIAGDLAVKDGAPNGAGGKTRSLSFKARQRLHESLRGNAGAQRRSHAPRGIIRAHFPHSRAAGDETDFNEDLRQLEDKLAALPDRDAVMAALAELMSPASHHTAAGLMATRIFTRLFEA